MSGLDEMTPRQRVREALAHRAPARVPFSWGFGPTPEATAQLTAYLAERGLSWQRLRDAASDTCAVGVPYRGPALPADTDIWGIRRTRMQYGEGAYDEIAHYPLAGVEEIAALADCPWPDPTLYDDDAMRGLIETANPHRRRALRISGGNVFETYCWMTGLEEAMINLLTAPDLVSAALERITGFFLARLTATLTRCGDLVDLVFLADDLGSQQGLLLSRASYRDIIQPFHRQLTACVRRYAPDAYVLFHSDGAVFDIVPDLIDAGVQVLEAVQTDAVGMDPARLKAAYGDQLSFHGAISVQSLLPYGTPDSVVSETRRLVETLGANGGYIAAPAHAIQVGTPPENVLAMLRAVLGDAVYAEVLAQARE